MRHPLMSSIIAGALAIGGLTAGSTQAAVRAGGADDPMDMQRPSLDPTYYTDVQHVQASYDETGSVTVAVTFLRPEAHLYAKATLATSCSGLDDPDQPSASAPARAAPRLTATLRWDDYSSAEGNDIERGAGASLEGYDSSVGADTQLSADGLTISATFSHLQFAHRDWRCVSGQGGPGGIGGSYGNDDFTPFYFAGYAPKSLTAEAATQALQDRLAAVYGRSYTASAKRWAKCPSDELLPPDPEYDMNNRALCMFDFKNGSRWLFGEATVEVDDLSYAVKITYKYRYSKQTVRCPSRYLKTEHYADGTVITARKLWAQKGDCRGLPRGAGMAGDLDYPAANRFPRAMRSATVGWHGTNTAGFQEKVRFPCKVRSKARGRARHYDITCANELDDKFRYVFEVRRG